MRIVSFAGSPGFRIALLVLIVWRLTVKGRRRAAVLFVSAVLGGEALDEMAKLIFHRIRPVPFFGLSAPTSFSFPSGHALGSCCFYGVLAAIVAERAPRYRAIIWTAATAFVILIGISRIYLGVHYPSDVLAGYVAAIIWVFALRSVYLWWGWRRAAT